VSWGSCRGSAVLSLGALFFHPSQKRYQSVLSFLESKLIAEKKLREKETNTKRKQGFQALTLLLVTFWIFVGPNEESVLFSKSI
jgi:hypothetical protein